VTLVTPRSIAVIGAGWAGLAAALDLAEHADIKVTVFEMAPQPGGRARSILRGEGFFDNGQHIMVGAYRETLELLRRVGVDKGKALLRSPLTLVNPQGRGLRLPGGPAALAFARGVLGASHWPWRARLTLLRRATSWRLRGFAAAPGQTVADIADGLPGVIVRELIDPLCIAALNTPADQASATVFLRVLKDALFSGPGSSDLLLPRCSLADLLPDPAFAHLAAQGVDLRLRSRVQTLRKEGASRWWVGDEAFDGIVLACHAAEAARLTLALNETWSTRAAAVRYQSIVTVYAAHENAALAWPMLALDSNAAQPAQFVFDHGVLSSQRGLLAFVISGANAWLERGLDATVQATLEQARKAFTEPWASKLKVAHAVAEKRATFACTPALDRPPAEILQGLWAAGDYVEGPYPATLEGAIRSGKSAAVGVLSDP
jgi:hydroxysqualene dehydroxylase